MYVNTVGSPAMGTYYLESKEDISEKK